MHPPSVQHRFDDKYTAEPNSGCWLWTAGCDPQGYGQIGIDGQTQQAHRVSWEISNGPIPDGLYVLHRCDVTCCVNPDHLFLGTHLDNMADMVAKGRGNWSLIPGLCHRGHATSIHRYLSPKGKIGCKACSRIAVTQYRARLRLKAA